ncbi:MAG: sporulation protein [Burkholderiaceae bacterium]|jgi:hypothetical protein|nr:sporulation protein [Burkholderiaceae bacterium]
MRTFLVTLFSVLVLANLLYFAWAQGVFVGLGMTPDSLNEREPQRLTHQIRPEALRVISNPAPVPAAPGPTASAPAPAASAPVQPARP